MNLFKASKRFCISLILIFLIGAMPFSTALEGYIEEINPDTHGGNTGGNADANQNHETSGNVCNAEQLKKFDLNSNNALDASDVLIMERIFKRVDPSSAIASLDSDGRFNENDIRILNECKGTPLPDNNLECSCPDLNNDKDVDIDDIDVLIMSLGSTNSLVNIEKSDRRINLGDFSCVAQSLNQPSSEIAACAETIGKCTKCTDTNHDGEINLYDMSIVARNVGTAYQEFDLDNSGSVDDKDLQCIKDELGQEKDATTCEPEIDSIDDDSEIKFCDQCGDGVFNLCDENECSSIKGCTYKSGFISGSCDYASETEEEIIADSVGDILLYENTDTDYANFDSDDFDIRDELVSQTLNGWKIEHEQLLLDPEDTTLDKLFEIIPVSNKRKISMESLGAGFNDVKKTAVAKNIDYGDIDISEKRFIAWKYDNGKIVERIDFIDENYGYDAKFRGSISGFLKLPEQHRYAVVHKYKDEYNNNGRLSKTIESRFKTDSLMASLKPNLQKLPGELSFDMQKFITKYATNTDEEVILWSISDIDKRISVRISDYVRTINKDPIMVKIPREILEDGEIESYSDNGFYTKFVRIEKIPKVEIKGEGMWTYEEKVSYWSIDNMNGMLLETEGSDPLKGSNKVTGNVVISGIDTDMISPSHMSKTEKGDYTKKYLPELEKHIQEIIRRNKGKISLEEVNNMINQEIGRYIDSLNGIDPERKLVYTNAYRQAVSNLKTPEEKQLAAMKLAEESLKFMDVEGALYYYNQVEKQSGKLGSIARDAIKSIEAQKAVEMSKLFVMQKFFQEMDRDDFGRSVSSTNEFLQREKDKNLLVVFFDMVNSMSPGARARDEARIFLTYDNFKDAENALTAIDFIQTQIKNGKNLREAYNSAIDPAKSPSLTDEQRKFLSNEPSMSYNLYKTENTGQRENALLEMAEKYKKEGNFMGAAMVAYGLRESTTNKDVYNAAVGIYEDITGETKWHKQPAEFFHSSNLYDIGASLANPYSFIIYGAAGKAISTAVGGIKPLASLVSAVKLPVSFLEQSLPKGIAGISIGVGVEVVKEVGEEVLEYKVEEAYGPAIGLAVSLAIGGLDSFDAAERSAREALSSSFLHEKGIVFDDRLGVLGTSIEYEGDINPAKLAKHGKVEVDEIGNIRFTNKDTGELVVFERSNEIYFKPEKGSMRPGFTIKQEFDKLTRMHNAVPEHTAQPVELVRSINPDTKTEVDVGYRMEYVPGVNLPDFDEMMGGIPKGLKVEILKTVDKYHQAGIVHNDLYQNIRVFYNPEKAAWDFKIIDPFPDPLPKDIKVEKENEMRSIANSLNRMAEKPADNFNPEELDARLRERALSARISNVDVVASSTNPITGETLSKIQFEQLIQNLRQGTSSSATDIGLSDVAVDISPEIPVRTFATGDFAVVDTAFLYNPELVTGEHRAVADLLRLGEKHEGIISLTGETAKNGIFQNAGEFSVSERINIRGNKKYAAARITEQLQKVPDGMNGNSVFLKHIISGVAGDDGNIEFQRWSSAELSSGVKEIDGNSISLGDVAERIEFAKIDAVAEIDGRLTSASNLVSFTYEENGVVKPLNKNSFDVNRFNEVAISGTPEELNRIARLKPEARQRYLDTLDKEIEKHMTGANTDYYKAAVKMYERAVIEGDASKRAMFEQLFGSKTAEGMQIVSDMSALEFAMNTRMPKDRIILQMDSITARLSQQYTKFYSETESILKQTNKFLENGDYKSAKSRIKYIGNILNDDLIEETRQFMKANNLFLEIPNSRDFSSIVSGGKSFKISSEALRQGKSGLIDDGLSDNSLGSVWIERMIKDSGPNAKNALADAVNNLNDMQLSGFVHKSGDKLSDVYFYTGDIDIQALKGIGNVEVDGSAIKFEKSNGDSLIFIKQDIHQKKASIGVIGEDGNKDVIYSFKALTDAVSIEPEHTARPIRLRYDGNGLPIYDMVSIPGDTLQQFSIIGGRIPESLFNEILNYFDRLHASGTAHGDIHIKNIMVFVNLEGDLDFMIIDPNGIMHSTKSITELIESDNNRLKLLREDLVNGGLIGTPTNNAIEMLRNIDTNPAGNFGGEYVSIKVRGNV